MGKMTEYESRTIYEWLMKIHQGKIALPSFQRDYVWKPAQVSELLKALLKDRPVGAFLTMSFTNARPTPAFKPRSFFDVGDENQTFEGCEELVLDGQQRLTSLWRALKAESARQQYFVKVENWDSDELEVARMDDPVRLERDKSKVVKDHAHAKELKLIPIRILGIDGVTQEDDALYKWCASVYSDDEEGREHARQLTRKIDTSFAQKLHHRGLWFIQLPEGLPREDAIEIYIKTNQSSSIVKPFDIAVAEYDRQKEDSLRNEILGWVEQTPEAKRLFNSDPEKVVPDVGELILKIACLQKKKVPTEKSYMSSAVIEYLQRENAGLKKILDGLDWAFRLLEEINIFYRTYLPSTVPLQVVPALHPEFEKIKDPDRRGLARNFLFAYIWRSFLGDRYTREVNTKLKEDYGGLVELLSHISEHGQDGVQNKTSGVPVFLEEVTFPDLRVLSRVKDPIKSPTTKNMIARSLLIVSTQGGARDFASGEAITKLDIEKRERHHIFPRNFLQKNGIENPLRNHALNFCLITGPANKKFSNKTPLKQITERFLENRHLTEAALKQRIASHLIPYEAIKDVGEKNVKATYRYFIKERAKMFIEKIQVLTKVPFQ